MTRGLNAGSDFWVYDAMPATAAEACYTMVCNSPVWIAQLLAVDISEALLCMPVVPGHKQVQHEKQL